MLTFQSCLLIACNLYRSIVI